jgi:hypothetical protein
LVRSRKTTKETDMNALVLSALAFQAIATVVLMVGVAIAAIIPARSTHG